MCQLELGMLSSTYNVLMISLNFTSIYTVTQQQELSSWVVMIFIPWYNYVVSSHITVQYEPVSKHLSEQSAKATNNSFFLRRQKDIAVHGVPVLWTRENLESRENDKTEISVQNGMLCILVRM